MPPRSACRAALVACALLTATAHAETTRVLDLPEPAGPVLLMLPDAAFGERPRGLVLVLPDSVGADGRAAAYADALLAQGVAVAELGLDGPAADAARLEQALVLAHRALAADPRFGAERIALLGFGEGARTAAGWAGTAPVALVYPRCAAIELGEGAEATPGAQPVLLLHPAQDATDTPGACARLGEQLGGRLGVAVLRHAYPDATPGWDIPPLGAVAGPSIQPRDADAFAGRPDGLRYRAVPRPAVTLDAARRVAWFVSAALEGSGPWEPPAMP